VSVISALDTTPPTRILLYDDSPVFGGHEVMTLLGVEALAAQTDWQLQFFASASNDRLTDQLKQLAAKYPSLTVTPLAHSFHRLQGILNHVQRGRIATLAQQFRETNADLALIIQGDIEISSTGLLAARKANIPTISYIPLPHNQVEKGGKYGAARDLFAQRLYRAPDGFITISTVLADMLRSKGVTAPVKVVYNGITTQNFKPVDRSTARTTLALPQDAPVIGIAGRLERKQKQQQLLIEAIATTDSSAPPLFNAHAAFCGDGQDRPFLQQLATTGKVTDRTHFLEWRDDLATFYSALDILAIPSRYEGVPLVMLEALCCGTPVVAGNRDGMKEMLPPEWLFEPGDIPGFRNAIAAVLTNVDATRAHVARLQQRIHQSMTVDAFGHSFVNALTEFHKDLGN
jgi:glycosyltransferase involved in cell wall biosynthesis